MTIQRKLLLNFLLVAVIVLACSLLGIWSIRKINASLDYVTSRAWSAANAAMQTSIDNLTRIVAADEYLRGEQEQARVLMQRYEQRFSAKLDQLSNTHLANETLINNIKKLSSKLTILEAKTLANYHLRNRTKLQLDQNALVWTRMLEKLRARLTLSKSADPKAFREGENTLVSIGLLSLAERSAVNNYLAGSIREAEIADLLEGFRSNIKRKILDLSKNPIIPPPESNTISSIYSEAIALSEKLLAAHRDYHVEQQELSHNTLRLVDSFEEIKESMNENMEHAAIDGRQVAKSSQRYFAIFAFIAFLFAILIGIAITRHITSPILGLTRATQAIAKGDLAARVDASSKDEIGQLGLSFNQMADDILRFTEEIRQKSLQAEIANQELQVTNRELYQALGELEKQSEILKDTNKELQKATRLKSEFLANMSHELRTPMNSIIGFTKLVLRKSEQSLESKQKENLQKVLISAEQLLELINAILDLSKIESGKMEVYVEPFVMVEIVEHVREILWPLVMEKRLKFTASVDPNLPRIYSDPEKVKQIVINLCSNAVKFTEKGEISLVIKRVLATLNAHPSTDCMEILVSDTGIGIPAKTQEIIFEDFRQADGSTTRKYGGTGLGLSICRKLCILLGGDISLAESTLGRGSKFRVILPIDFEIEKRLSENRQNTPAPSTKDAKILVAHDGPGVLDQLQAHFPSKDVQILLAKDSGAAYETCMREHPDLILLDIALPEHSAWTLIAQIKSNPDTSKIPIVSVKSGGKNGMFKPLLVNDYLTKPFDQETLRAMVSRYLTPSSRNILLVDKDSSVHDICKKYLEGKGISLHSAYSVEEANNFLSSLPPDLVILDLDMLAQNGSDWFELLNTAILAMTPKNASQEELAGLEKIMARWADQDGVQPEGLSRRIMKILNARKTNIPSLF